MGSDRTRTSFTCYYKSEKYAGSNDAGKCQPMVADLIDPQRRQHAGVDADHHGKWSIMLNHIYMRNFRPSGSSHHSSYTGRLRISTPKAKGQSPQQTTVFKMDIFSNVLLKSSSQFSKMYDPSTIFFPTSSQKRLGSGLDKRLPDWHLMSLPQPKSGEPEPQTVTVRIGNGGDSAGYGVDGPYYGLKPVVKILKRELPVGCLWRLSFRIEMDNADGGEPKLGQLATIRPSYLARRTSEHFGDSIQIWVGVEDSDNAASLHYAFVDGKRHMGNKTKVSYYIFDVDRVEHLGDEQSGNIIRSSYVIKLRAHLGPSLLDEPTFVLPEPLEQDDDHSNRESADPEEDTNVFGDDSQTNGLGPSLFMLDEPTFVLPEPQQQDDANWMRENAGPEGNMDAFGDYSQFNDGEQTGSQQASPQQASFLQADQERNAAQFEAVALGLAYPGAYDEETIDPRDLQFLPIQHKVLPRTHNVSHEPRGNPLRPTILSGNQPLGVSQLDNFTEAMYVMEYATRWENFHQQGQQGGME